MPEIHDAAQHRVTLVAEPAFGLGGRQARIEIRLRNGQTIHRESSEPRGEPTNPLSAEELERKFIGMAALTIDDERATELNRTLMDIETLENASIIPGMTVVADGKPALRAA